MTRDAVRKLPTSLLIIGLALVLAACRPGGDGAAGSNAGGQATASGLAITISVDGTTIGSADVEVGARVGSEPVTGATVEVRGDMTHAGMAPVLAAAAEAGPGVYRADDFAFTMAGDWIVSATVTTADGRKASAETFVNVSR